MFIADTSTCNNTNTFEKLYIPPPQKLLFSPLETFNCPNCGAEVKVSAKSCPECGADDETGWQDNAFGHSIAGPDDFDYEDFVANEMGGTEGIKPKGTPWWVWVLALIMIAAFVLASMP